MNKNIVISIAVYDTDHNDRTKYTIQTYESLIKTVNPDTTNIVFINNGSCKKTVDFLESIKEKHIYLLNNKENIGTAEAVNLGWKLFENVPYKLKVDNDLSWEESGWADEMVRILKMDKTIGVLGLKRKDLPNQPGNEGDPTELIYLNHELGDKWDYHNVIELSKDVIGSCVMIGPEVFKKVGYLWQPGTYSFDDSLYCARTLAAGFVNAFYPWIEMDHNDIGGTPFTEWKKRIAGTYINKVSEYIKEYHAGERDVYYNPFID